MQQLNPFRSHPLAASLVVAWCALSGPVFAQDTQDKPKLDVIYVPTPQEVVDRMLEMAQVKSTDFVIDLGCGDGRNVVTAAQKFGARGFGVDIDPQRIKEAKENAEKAGVADKTDFRVANLFETKISDANVMMMYLLSSINLKLRPRILDEMAPGTRIVSHAFDMGDWKPDERDTVGYRNVYLWIVPAKVEGRWNVKTADGQTMALDLKQQFQEVDGTATVGRPRDADPRRQAARRRDQLRRRSRRGQDDHLHGTGGRQYHEGDGRAGRRQGLAGDEGVVSRPERASSRLRRPLLSPLPRGHGMESPQRATPRARLTVLDAVALIVGIVFGIGIYKTPPLVAANVDSGLTFMALWVVGGFVTLVGALCYAELATAYPSAGGEYHFLSRAYGKLGRGPVRLGARHGCSNGRDRARRVRVRRLRLAAPVARAVQLGDLCGDRGSRPDGHQSRRHRAGHARPIPVHGRRAHDDRRRPHGGVVRRRGTGDGRDGPRRRGRRRRRARPRHGVRAAHLRRLERSRLHLRRDAGRAAQHPARAGDGDARAGRALRSDELRLSACPRPAGLARVRGSRRRSHAPRHRRYRGGRDRRDGVFRGAVRR